MKYLRRVFWFWALLLPMLAFALEGAHPIGPGLRVGGQPDQAALAAFAEAGGALVIDLRMPDEDRGLDEAEAVAALGLRYLNLPIDGDDDITTENARTLHRALAEASGPVFLHCKTGNRVGALLALDALAHGQSREQALELARQAGMDKMEPMVRERLGCSPEAC